MPFGGHVRRASLTADRALDHFDRRREQADGEEGPEPGDEEHHFRRDEQDHAVAQVQLHDRRVIALLRFANDVAPPAEHRHDDAEQAQQEDELAVGIVVHPHHAAAGQRERGKGADQRPLIGRKDVIIVVLGRGHGFPNLVIASALAGRFPDFPPDKMCSSR